MSQTGGVYIILSFIVALIISYITTPFAEKLAFKVGAVDVPKDNRRMHKEPKARLGGLAIFCGFLVSVLAFSEFVLPTGSLNKGLIGILLGTLIIVILGIFDDVKPRSAKLKFLIQLVAAAIPVFMGVRVIVITNPFTDELLRLPTWLSIAGSIFWIAGVTNAVNLLDGLDGLAAGVSSIAAIALLSILLLVHSSSVTLLVMAAALAGACFGFLPYNFNPARLFMGDTGATFLGFVLACVSIQGPFKTYVAVFVPLIVLGLPIFDTTFAILRRFLKGQPIMAPDRGHLHHRLIDKGFSHKKTVIILYVLSAVLAVGAIIMLLTDMFRGLLVMIAFVLVGVFAFNKAGRHHEEQEKKEEPEEQK
ncbi:MAG: undecaprenyl/decaprenyl-phosphate alpha-N-acetylglucosaminyl 1-phosphate transferase [Clostridia bacterium]|nr:undecaprenyl/decaprenyl-phosphate alpha-N-acetylglucosaminyl 1-phosphate transferase [Clostridia bacterium]